VPSINRRPILSQAELADGEDLVAPKSGSIFGSAAELSEESPHETNSPDHVDRGRVHHGRLLLALHCQDLSDDQATIVIEFSPGNDSCAWSRDLFVHDCARFSCDVASLNDEHDITHDCARFSCGVASINDEHDITNDEFDDAHAEHHRLDVTATQCDNCDLPGELLLVLDLYDGNHPRRSDHPRSDWAT
jgi:hypothetical protein